MRPVRIGTTIVRVRPATVSSGDEFGDPEIDQARGAEIKVPVQVQSALDRYRAGLPGRELSRVSRILVLRRDSNGWTPAVDDAVLLRGSVMVVSGVRDALERASRIPGVGRDDAVPGWLVELSDPRPEMLVQLDFS